MSITVWRGLMWGCISSIFSVLHPIRVFQDIFMVLAEVAQDILGIFFTKMVPIPSKSLELSYSSNHVWLMQLANPIILPIQSIGEREGYYRTTLGLPSGATYEQTHFEVEERGK